MSRIAIVVGHSRIGTFCEALGEHYAQGAHAAAHEATLFVTAKMSFNPILHEGFERVQPLEPDLQAAHDAIRSADHLVLIFPLWVGGMPAIFKGFLERVLQPDLIEPSKQKKFVRLLKGKSARIIVTMGMPAFVYRCWFRAHAVKVLQRNILGWMGVRPIRTTLYGSIEAVSRERREQWLRHVEKLGRQAA